VQISPNVRHEAAADQRVPVQGRAAFWRIASAKLIGNFNDYAVRIGT
jgi:hypothetical protein